MNDKSVKMADLNIAKIGKILKTYFP
jgi:hypothetical protein